MENEDWDKGGGRFKGVWDIDPDDGGTGVREPVRPPRPTLPGAAAEVALPVKELALTGA